MQISSSPTLLILFLVGILGLIAIGVAFYMRPARQSRSQFAVAVLPAIIMLAMFYSLAIHMHASLGAWPSSIGERGFSKPLTIHANIAAGYFMILFLVSIFVWPVAFLLCAYVRHWRTHLYYLGVYALSCFVCFGGMLLAPKQFLYWWRD